jgi:choline dehydrogenase
MIQATLMLELSAGAVMLAPPKLDGTPDIEAMPVIEMGWLTHEADRFRLRDAMRLSLQLAESAEMSMVIERPIAPAADEVNSESADAVFDSWIASHVVSSQHQTSTCRMGGPHDPEAVCDEEGRVLGTEGLRVVDASLMPDCPRANTQATTYMIGERIARIINAGSLEAAIRAVTQSAS